MSISESNTSILQGWLYKTSPNSKVSRMLKRRWFSYDNDTKKLLYYRDPSNAIILGSIDIIDCFIEHKSLIHVDQTYYYIDIHTPKKVYRLLDENRETILTWESNLRKIIAKLQEVWLHNLNNVQCITENPNSASDAKDHDIIDLEKISRVNNEGLVKKKKSSFIDFSIKNLSTEAKNMAHSVKEKLSISKPSQADTSPIWYNNEISSNCLDDTAQENITCENCNKHLETISKLQSELFSREEAVENSNNITEEMGENDLKNYITVLHETIAYKDILLQNEVSERRMDNIQKERDILNNQYSAIVIERNSLVKENERFLKINQDYKAKLDKMAATINKVTAYYLNTNEKLRSCLNYVPEPKGNVDSLEKDKETDFYGFFTDLPSSDSYMADFTTRLSHPSRVFDYISENNFAILEERLLQQWNAKSDLWHEDIKKGSEIKQLIRMGIPVSIRRVLWSKLALSRLMTDVDQIKSIKQGTWYQKQLNEVLNETSPLAQQSKHQIDLDLPRCMPENTHFRVPQDFYGLNTDVEKYEFIKELDERGCSKVLALRNVLLCFANYSNAGYCQGIDRVAACLLLNMDECYVTMTLIIMLSYMRPKDYYNAQLKGAHIDQRVFCDLAKTYCPSVISKIQETGLDLCQLTFSWMLTLFIDNFNWKIHMKIIDGFFYEGDKVLFRFAVAILIYLEPILIEQTDASGIMAILRNVGVLVVDFEKLSQIAYKDIRHFSKRLIKQKRDIFEKEINDILIENQRRRKLLLESEK